MDFRVLGAVGINDRDHLIPFGGSKPRLVLAVLLAHRNRVVSTDALVDALWGESPPPAARATLHSHVSRLRRHVETAGKGSAARLLASPPGYVLVAPDDLVDAGHFEGLLEQGRALLHLEPAAALALLDEALASWHGDAFAEFAHEEAVYAEAVRLEELRLAAREDRVEAMLILGRQDEAAGEAEAIIAGHPLRERVWSQLMLGLAGSGRPAEALRAAERLRRHLAELGLEPSLAVRELEQAILTEAPGMAWQNDRVKAPSSRQAAIPNNLPVELTAFVGRHREVGDVVSMVNKYRLVTLTGVGGVGKSRLGLRAARVLLPEQPEGVFLVELAALQDAALVVPHVARTLGLSEVPGRTVSETLDEHLASRRLVLVLDNCEHLAAAVAGFVEHLLRTAPEVRVLATSRVRLGVAGEALWPVPVLDLPEAEDRSAEAADAVQLFAERARLVDPEFTLEDAALASAARICRRVEGIPLAIELAAARLGVLSVAQVELRLDDLTHLLAEVRRTDDPRHRTMQVTLDWSHDLLQGSAQAMFRRLSVFQGGFDLEAAEAVGAFDPLARADTLDVLQLLVEASLVARSRPFGRYHLLEPVRQYAAGRLDLADERSDVARRHGAHYRAMIAGAHDQLQGADQANWFARLDIEADNLRLALGWGLEKDPASALTMASELGSYWLDRGHHSEARRWLRDVVASSGVSDSGDFALCLLTSSQLSSFEGDHDRAAALADRAGDMGSRLNDPRVMAHTTLRRASLAWDNGRTGDAVPLYEDAVERLDALGSPSVTYALANLGLMLCFMGEFERSEAIVPKLQEAVERHHQPDGEAILAEHLAVLTMYQGRATESWEHISHAVPERRQLGRLADLVNVLRRSMWPAIALRRYDDARAAFDEALDMCRQMGYRPGESGLFIVAGRLHLATGEIEEARRELARGMRLLGGWRRADWAMFGLFESGRAALASGRVNEAAKLHGASAAIRERAPLTLVRAQQEELTEDLRRIDRTIGREEREAAWQKGAVLTTLDACALAIEILVGR